MPSTSTITSACAALLLLAGPALAQQTNGNFTGLKLSGDQPIQIESDKLEVRDAEATAVFTGNVNVVQGDTLLKAGKMVVRYKKKEGEQNTTSAMPGAGAIEHIDVDGKVYVKSKNQVATGDAGTFDMGTEIMVLTGREVVLTEGPNVVVGCKLTVEMRSGAAKLDGCGSGSGRVKMLLTPQNKPKDQ